MGANQSNTVRQTTEVLNSTVNNVVSSSRITSQAKATNSNTFELVIGPNADIQCDNIDFSQKIRATQTVKVMAKIQNSTELQNMLKAAVDNATKQSNDSVNNFLSTSFNNQETNTEITNILHNEIENNITNENVQECNAIIDNANNNKLQIYGKLKCKNLGAPQEIINDQVVECITDQLIKAVSNNQQIADAINKSESENKSKNTGPLEALAGLWFLFPIILIVGGLFVAKQLGITPGQIMSNKPLIIGIVAIIILVTVIGAIKSKGRIRMFDEKKVYTEF